MYARLISHAWSMADVSRCRWSFTVPCQMGAEKKRLAVTIRGERMYVVLMIRAPASSFALNFPQTGRTLGDRSRTSHRNHRGNSAR
jgi:hypothetical protein